MENAKLMSNVMGSIIINIPPLTLQGKMVDVLDKSDNYTNSIESGLKGEIEKNQKKDMNIIEICY